MRYAHVSSRSFLPCRGIAYLLTSGASWPCNWIISMILLPGRTSSSVGFFPARRGSQAAGCSVGSGRHAHCWRVGTQGNAAGGTSPGTFAYGVTTAQARGDYYPERKSLDADKVPAPPPDYIAYPKAMKTLTDRLGATPEELAAWIFMGPDTGGIVAYWNANELNPPPRFYFDYFMARTICRHSWLAGSGRTTLTDLIRLTAISPVPR
jgi:hypothetical protein